MAQWEIQQVMRATIEHALILDLLCRLRRSGSEQDQHAGADVREHAERANIRQIFTSLSHVQSWTTNAGAEFTRPALKLSATSTFS
jgi:hypothetical protein